MGVTYNSGGFHGTVLTLGEQCEQFSLQEERQSHSGRVPRVREAASGTFLLSLKKMRGLNAQHLEGLGGG